MTEQQTPSSPALLSTEFTIQEQRWQNPSWKLVLSAEQLQLVAPDGTEHLITRSDFRRFIDLDTLVIWGKLQVRQPIKTRFKLDPPACAALRAWVGPLTREDMAATLKFSSWYLIPAVMFGLAGGSHIAAWLNSPQESPSVSFLGNANFWAAILLFCAGAGSVFLWVATRLVPHRSLFLISALILLAFCLHCMISIMHGYPWIERAIVILVFGAGAYFRLMQYRAYAPAKTS